MNEDEDLESFLILGICVTIFVIIVGGLSNLLTIATLIHQKYLPRLQRSISWSANTILIFNLALADLSYCFINLPFITIAWIRVVLENEKEDEDKKDPFTHSQCEFPAFWRYGTAIVEWTTLGLIALERCVNIRHINRYHVKSKYFTARRMILACVLIWIIGITLQVPVLFNVFPGFEFGYNNKTYKCDFIESFETNTTDEVLVNPRLIFFGLYLSIPLTLIIGCYSFIIYNVCTSNNMLKRQGTDQSRQVSTRRSRTTTIIIGIISAFLVAVLPMSLWNICQEVCDWKNEEQHKTGIVLYCLYWLQYSVNCIIYAYSRNFRKAVVQFLQFVTCGKVDVFNRLLCTTNKNNSSIPRLHAITLENDPTDLPLDSPLTRSRKSSSSRTSIIRSISESLDKNYDFLKRRNSMGSFSSDFSSAATSVSSLVSFKVIEE